MADLQRGVKVTEVKPKLWRLKAASIWLKKQRLKIAIALALAFSLVIAIVESIIQNKSWLPPFETLAQINATVFALALTIPLAASQFAKYPVCPESFFDKINLLYFTSYASSVFLPILALGRQALYPLVIGLSVMCMTLLFPFLFRTSEKFTPATVIKMERARIINQWKEKNRSEYGGALENIARSALASRDYSTFQTAMDSMMLLVQVSMALPWEWSSDPLQPGASGLTQAVSRIGETALDDRFAIAIWCKELLGIATERQFLIDGDSSTLKLIEYDHLAHLIHVSGSKPDAHRTVVLFMIEWGIFNAYAKSTDMDNVVSKCANVLSSLDGMLIDDAFRRTRQRFGLFALFTTSTSDPIRPLPFSLDTTFRIHLADALSRLEARVSEIFVDREADKLDISSKKLVVPSLEDSVKLAMLQRKCYLEEAMTLGDWGMLQLTETSSDMMDYMKSWVFLVSVADGRMIGAVRGRIEDGKCVVARLFVHPRFRKMGIGTELLKGVENRFSGVKVFEAFIGRKQSYAVAFLKKNSYAISSEFTLSNDATYSYMSKTR